MQDEVNWKLSLLLDDELEPSEAIGLLEQIHRDSELLMKWYSYQTIRQALKGNRAVHLHPDFLERVRIALADETFSVSSDLSQQGRRVNLKRLSFSRWTVPLAMAAVVIMVVVLMSKRMVFNSPNSTPPLMVAKPTPHLGGGKPSRQASSYSQLEDYYLLVHSENSLDLTGPQHVLGYARIVSRGEQ